MPRKRTEKQLAALEKGRVPRAKRAERRARCEQARAAHRTRNPDFTTPPPPPNRRPSRSRSAAQEEEHRLGRRGQGAYIAGGSRRRSSAGASRGAVVLSSSSSSLVPSPVVVLVSRLLFGRRSVLSEGAARGGRWATRARRARRAYIAGGSHRRSSAGTSRAGGPLLLVLFSRPFAGRRPRLASSRRSPLRAERGRGARGATSDTRATRATRVHRGWFSSTLLSRDIARRGGPLLLVILPCLSSRPSLRARAAPSLHPRAGGERAHHERARGRAPSATRRARRAGSPISVGGSGQRAQGWFRVTCVLCAWCLGFPSSLVRVMQPVRG